MRSELVLFLWGVYSCACFGSAVAFASTWRRVGDRFFLLFSLAFALLCVERIALLGARELSEATSPFAYVVRLIAFAIIIVAIVDKNRAGRRTR
jgi:hypothetical protein